MGFINIANRDYITKGGVSAGITGAHTTNTYATDIGSVVLANVGKRCLLPGKIWNSRNSSNSGATDKPSSVNAIAYYVIHLIRNFIHNILGT
tara:strand:+ start:26 stop:301 length:276 start_codon:yes stop_codon:yes gene_type:complete